MAEGPAPGSFADRVAAAVAATGPLCAGIDPSPDLLERWGLPDDADGLRRFGLACVEAFAGVVPVVKPQVAFFERRGSAGIAALEVVVAEARAAGLLVIGDAKRGDIGTTMEAYASAWLDPDSPLSVDAVTALAYLGLGALEPLFDLAARHGRGVIVVVRSSNPEGRTLQEARTGGGRGPAVEDDLLGAIAQLNRGARAGTVGAVVGATLAPSEFRLPDLGGVILAPGVGAQGAGAAEVGALFAGCPPGSVLASASRSVLGAGPSVAGLADAARAARDEMRAALG
jgi:orotidine-5'-phosphate decarboxylase